MADKVEQPKEVEEVKKTKPVENDDKPEVEVEEKVKNGDEKAEENGAEKPTETDDEKPTEEKCTIKRKSTGGGDATDNASAEDQPTPEKKAKVSESTETDGKEETEAAA